MTFSLKSILLTGLVFFSASAHAGLYDLQRLARDTQYEIQRGLDYTDGYTRREIHSEMSRAEQTLQYALRYPGRPSGRIPMMARSIVDMLDRARPYDLDRRTEREVESNLSRTIQLLRGGGGHHPQPPPYNPPAPPPYNPPAPPPYNPPAPPMGNPCQGQINGTWGYKGGRAMQLNLAFQGGNRVMVTIAQQNGGESAAGTCNASFDGSASVQFQGQFNSGTLTIDAAGNVSGVVSGFSFNGRKN